MAATDIVDLIGRTVSLKKRGKDHVGLCPFHQEKSPSFTVNQARQFYYCYGCKAGGDAINFVKQRDRVEFMDALKTLAQDAGIPVPSTGRSREDATETQICLEANSSATMFFEKALADPARGKVARDYLAGRGFTDETIKKFRLGLAPEGWDNLLRSEAVRKFQPQQLHTAGLVKARENGGGFYDVFRNRLMFPIRDPNGRVIAFGGRRVNDADNPKYLNSPETPVFHKSRSIYGLDQARQRIVETQTAVVVEGYTDVVMAHQFGATNVVSPLGTALTHEHVTLLRRFAGRIVLLFDPDTAGDLAVDRAVELFLTQPVEIAIASLGEDLDPDEYLLKHGLESFEKLIGSAPGALAYKWKGLVRQFAADDGNNLTGQQKAVETYLELIGQARQSGPVDPIRWGLVVSQVAKLTGIPTEQLHRRLSASKPAAPRPATTGGAENAVSGPAQGASLAPKLEQPRKRGVLSARARAEQMILGTLLLWPAKWQTVQTLLAPEDFTDDGRRKLAEVYWNHQYDEGEPVFNEFLALLGNTSQADSADGGVSGTDLRQLAIEMTEEVEAAATRQQDPDAPLREGLEHLKVAREAEEKQRLIAAARRSGEQNMHSDAQADLLRNLSARVPGAKI